MAGPVPIVCFDLRTVVFVCPLVAAALVYGAFAFITARKSARSNGPGKPVDGLHSDACGLSLEQEERGRCVAPVSGFLCCPCHHCPQIGPVHRTGIPVDGPHSDACGLSLEQEERGRCAAPVSGFLCCRGAAL